MNKTNLIKYLKVAVFIVTIQFFGFAQSDSNEGSFQHIRNEARQLWAQEKFDEAIDLLREHKHVMLDEYANFSYHYYLGLLYLEKSDAKNGFKILNGGMDKGYFYSFFPNRIEQIKKYEGGRELLAKNDELKSFAQDTATIKIDIKLPAKYNPKKEYPLIFFLHGNNSTLKLAKEEWGEVHLEKSAIVAFVQSSFPVSSYAYSWPDLERSRNDLKEAFNQVQQDYNINKEKIIVAGFSTGGRVAIDAVINDWFPATGFIAFSPAKLHDMGSIPKKDAINKRGFIIHGDKDYLYSDQQELISYLKAHRFKIKVKMVKGMGHEYPQEFNKYINEAIAFLINH